LTWMSAVRTTRGAPTTTADEAMSGFAAAPEPDATDGAISALPENAGADAPGAIVAVSAPPPSPASRPRRAWTAPAPTRATSATAATNQPLRPLTDPRIRPTSSSSADGTSPGGAPVPPRSAVHVAAAL